MAAGVHKIDKDKFFESYDRWFRGEITLTKAAEIVGISRKTLRKYFNYVIEGREFPDTLF